MRARWIVFAFAVPISLYVSFFGTVEMGFCPGIRCWPHTFAWTLLTPALLLAIWSLRATAIAGVFLLTAHATVEIHAQGLSTNTLWGNDMALDKCLWIAASLLVASALFPKKNVSKKGVGGAENRGSK